MVKRRIDSLESLVSAANEDRDLRRSAADLVLEFVGVFQNLDLAETGRLTDDRGTLLVQCCSVDWARKSETPLALAGWFKVGAYKVRLCTAGTVYLDRFQIAGLSRPVELIAKDPVLPGPGSVYHGPGWISRNPTFWKALVSLWVAAHPESQPVDRA